ncbi:hypothetical protein VAS14_00236 [Vibrio angustum S14]|uniref:Uncharacterized protein n=1 Tax=Photobacterium angustum (strain S14 / CCUG 15956) TaxID=314292 RepID=Q1ZJS2_PHOAS|nr:hypothetical protein VAS14_00236 [Vibrio angustum S14] [Photobacterium angustum S14]
MRLLIRYSEIAVMIPYDLTQIGKQPHSMQQELAT